MNNSGCGGFRSSKEAASLSWNCRSCFGFLGLRMAGLLKLVLGAHAHGAGMAETYWQKMGARPMRMLETLLQEIRQGVFHLDASRVGRLTMRGPDNQYETHPSEDSAPLSSWVHVETQLAAQADRHSPMREPRRGRRASGGESTPSMSPADRLPAQRVGMALRPQRTCREKPVLGRVCWWLFKLDVRALLVSAAVSGAGQRTWVIIVVGSYYETLSRMDR